MENTEFLIINFANNTTLAKKVYDYVSNILTNKMKLENDNIVIGLEKNNSNRTTKKEIKETLQKYLKSNEIYNDLQISEFDNVITIGIPKSIFEITDSKFCEICGFQMTNEEELLVHRRCHGIF